MACVNQMHQTIVLTQTESDDEEIDVITVDVNDEKLSQDLEYELLSKIEFEIDSDSDEFVDVVTVSPTKHTSTKVQANKNAVNESRLTLSQATVNGLSKTKLNNDSEEQCFTIKTSKRKIDQLDNDWDEKIQRMYNSKIRNVVSNKSDEPKTLKSTSVVREAQMKNGKVSDDNLVKKREKRKESKNGQTSNGSISAIDATKLKSSVKIILSRNDVNSHDDIGDDQSRKKTLRKYVSQTSSASALVLDKRIKRLNNRQMEGGEKASLLKRKRKCTRKSNKRN